MRITELSKERLLLEKTTADLSLFDNASTLYDALQNDEEPIEWRISDEPVPYPDAVAEMEARVAAIRAGEAPELVWLLEHPPLYTAGTSARSRRCWKGKSFP